MNTFISTKQHKKGKKNTTKCVKKQQYTA